jgi:hypothetical protein
MKTSGHCEALAETCRSKIVPAEQAHALKHWAGTHGQFRRDYRNLFILDFLLDFSQKSVQSVLLSSLGEMLSNEADA